MLKEKTGVFRNKNSFAEAIVCLLLIFFSSLFVLIQKVTKKSRLHQPYLYPFPAVSTLDNSFSL